MVVDDDAVHAQVPRLFVNESLPLVSGVDEHNDRTRNKRQTQVLGSLRGVVQLVHLRLALHKCGVKDGPLRGYRAQGWPHTQGRSTLVYFHGLHILIEHVRTADGRLSKGANHLVEAPIRGPRRGPDDERHFLCVDCTS